MDIEEEFEVKRHALELMKGRSWVNSKVKEASHKFDEDLERALFRAQEQMRTLVAATGEDIKQQAAVGDLEAAV